MRGVYPLDLEADRAWRADLVRFPYSVPRFDDHNSLRQFVYRHCIEQGHDERPRFQHIYAMLTTWDQLDTYVIQYLRYLHWSRCAPDRSVPYLDPDHGRLVASLRYLFNEKRSAIVVAIRDGRVALFAPFANEDFVNDWSHHLDMDADGIRRYYREKVVLHGARPENIEPDVSKWWSNGAIVANERGGLNPSQWQVWGDYYLPQLREMFEAACAAATAAGSPLPDQLFFINKRDAPIVPRAVAAERPKILPVVSFYTGPDFADLPLPSSEDWELATGKLYPATFMHKVVGGRIRLSGIARDLRGLEPLPWDRRISTAVFRGSATGRGITVRTNQRLALADMARRLNRPDLLDAALTGLNMRDRLVEDPDTGRLTLSHMKPSDFAFAYGRQFFMDMKTQARYKYAIYVDGHSAASRYSQLLRMGAVILKVESICEAPDVWYSAQLRPGIDHIPVRADLSDLVEKITWCREHDEECRQIALNARAFYDRRLSQSSMEQYVCELLRKMK